MRGPIGEHAISYCRSPNQVFAHDAGIVGILRSVRRSLGILVITSLSSAACADSSASASGETEGEPGSPVIDRIEGAHGAVCAYHADAAPVCWGLLPIDNLIGYDEPAADGRLDPLLLPFEHIEVVGVACGLHEGTAYCWGEDYGLGLLPYGFGDSVVEYEQALELGGVPIGEPIVAIDSGVDSHVSEALICALTDSGRLHCWGTSATLGYPGLGVIGDDETPADVGPIELGDRAVAVDVGGLGVCATLASGGVRCWGAPALTGGPTLGDDETPAQAPLLDLGAPIQAVSVGDNHACAIVGDGQVKCWGNGTRGELGQPGTFGAVPSAALEPIDLGGAAVEIVARIESTCARLESGDISCWGTGQYGRTGHPWDPACEASSDPVFGFTCSADPSCCIGDDETPAAAGPVELPAPARDLVGISVGACALLEDGAVHCWGGGFFGLIGDGLTPDCFDDWGWLCGHDPRCCVGDDETPAAADRPVLFE